MFVQSLANNEQKAGGGKGLVGKKRAGERSEIGKGKGMRCI